MGPHALAPSARKSGLRGLTTLLVVAISATATLCHASRQVLTASRVTAVRTGPSEDYNRITRLPPNVPLWAEGKVRQWYKVRLHEGLAGWVHEEDVRSGGDSQTRPSADVTNVAVEPYERGIRITVYLTARIPYRVRQSTWPNRLQLDLFGGRLANYGMRCRPIEAFITSLVPEQLMSDWAELTVGIDAPRQAGYDVYYGAGSTLVLDIRRPIISPGLAGKTVALDPGHGGHDLGAVGPSGLREKDVNLAIGLHLRSLLLARGATVIMTRETDTSLAGRDAPLAQELAARVQESRELWPDAFVSIHNNHLGAGDPSSARGTETYYWTPMSRPLAEALQVNVCAALGTEYRFVAWRPFHVLRDTDCPRALVECAYLSHPQEEALMRDERFPQRAAEGILMGLEAFFGAPGQ